MEKRMVLAMAQIASAFQVLADEEPPTMVLRRQPETYRLDDKVKLRKGGKLRKSGKRYAITADPSRIKIKAARKQSMKNRKKK